MPQAAIAALPSLATVGKVAQTVGSVAGAVGAVKGLTGGSSSGPSGSTTMQQTLDPATAARYQDIFNRAKGVAQQPFLPYTGPMVAGFNPDQLRQFQATRGLFESGMGYDPTKALQGMAQEQFKPTIQPVTGFQAPTIEATQAPGAAQIGPVSTPQFRGLLSQDIGAYQSPYQQQVIDLAMGDIQRQADIARGSAQDRAIRAGAFGGSRSALLESESQRPYAEQMAKTAAGLRQSGFEQAQAAAERDLARQQQLGVFGAGQEQQRALQQAQLGQQAGIFGAELGQQRRLQQAQMQQQRQMGGLDIAGRAALTQPQLEMQARAQRAGLLGGLQGQQLRGLGLLGGIGQQQQALQQAGIGESRGEFGRALAYGPQQLGLLQGSIAGMEAPVSRTDQYNPSRSEKFEAALNAYQTVAPIFSNLFQQTPQAPVQTLSGTSRGLF
jgi:hypothetical protein